ncbi:hypothetical protein [Halobellus inordinatus]|uniref:hypothetical protein n=1 Tax=Halobellus inordinatus TaxID=1126236 RepID=UPI002115A2E3|nr:hypothetical protein [Halobellus ramosii]
MNSNIQSLFIILLVVLGLTTVPVAFAAEEYSIHASESVDTEQRTVTVDGEEHQIRSVARVAVNNDLTANVEAPEGKTVPVEVRNSDREIFTRTEQTGSGTVSVDTSSADPGSYVLVLWNENGYEVEDVQPLVVAGWDASLSAPTAVEQGESLSATVTIDELTAMPEPESVEVVFTHEDSVVSRVDAEKTADGEYEATLDSDRDLGTYRVYANVRNTTTVDGRHEVVGVTDSHTIEIKSTTTTETPGEQTETETGSTGSGGGGSQPAATTTTSSETTTATHSTTSTTTSPATTAEPTSNASTTVTADSTAAATTAPENSGVITASSPTPTTTPTSTPGLGIVAGFVALASFVLLTRVYR